MGVLPADEETTLVLFHPIGNNQNTWQFLGLGGAVTPEYPGHGNAPRQPGWTHESFVDEVMGSISGRVDIVGMSMGGAIAAQVLARHPEKVRSAIICCAGAVSRGTMTPEQREAHKRKVLGRGRRGLDSGMASILDETLSRWFSPAALARPHAGVEFARQALLALDPQAWYEIWGASANSSSVSPDALQKFTQPITLVGGMHDWAAGLKGLLSLHGLLPNSRYEILTGPHMMQLEQPENLRAAIDRHFAWLPYASKIEDPIVTAGYADISIAQEGGRSL